MFETRKQWKLNVFFFIYNKVTQDVFQSLCWRWDTEYNLPVACLCHSMEVITDCEPYQLRGHFVEQEDAPKCTEKEFDVPT